MDEKVVRLKPKRNARDYFFAIDGRAWARAVSMGMGPAAVYIVLARGTDAQQRNTTWSVHAVEKYTGIGRPNAAKWIAALEEAGLIQRIKGGTRPAYRIVPAKDICCNGGNAAPSEPSEKNPHLIWLPNAFVSGAAGEAPPLELVRQTADVALLNLLVQLYADHDIADAGGIPREHVRQNYSTNEIGEFGQFTLFGFEPDRDITGSSKAPFAKPFMKGQFIPTRWRECGPVVKEDAGWYHFRRAWSTLVKLGLVVMIPHLVEGDDGRGDIIHPCSEANGTDAENALGAALHNAGLAMLPESRAEELTGERFVPVLQHRAAVSMVGIARLRYQPKTSKTRRWMARMPEWQALADRYNAVALGLRQGALQMNRATG